MIEHLTLSGVQPTIQVGRAGHPQGGMTFQLVTFRLLPFCRRHDTQVFCHLVGATTSNTTTLSIKTIGIMTFIIMTFSIITLSMMTLSL